MVEFNKLDIHGLIIEHVPKRSFVFVSTSHHGLTWAPPSNINHVVESPNVGNFHVQDH
jgi:hypothetical protein